MSTTRSLLLTALAVVTAGCHSFGVCAKRESELNCPTDVRKTVPWCAGEDAVFACPCGPNESFYGHRATCWRDWPTSAAAWRDMSCGPTVIAETTTVGEPNPFRGQPAAPTPAPEAIPNPIELPPLPAPEPQIGPTPKAIQESAPAESLGPPVLPPKTSAIQQPASTVVATAGPAAVPVAVEAPRDTKIKFVAAKSQLTPPDGLPPTPAIEPAAAAIELVDETAVAQAEYSNVASVSDSPQRGNALPPVADFVAPQQSAGAAPSENAPLGTASPTFVRPSIKVKLLR